MTADLNGVFIGRFVDSDFGLFNPPFVETPGTPRGTRASAVALTRQLAALLAIDNLTDRDYSEPFGYQPLRAPSAWARGESDEP